MRNPSLLGALFLLGVTACGNGSSVTTGSGGGGGESCVVKDPGGFELTVSPPPNLTAPTCDGKEVGDRMAEFDGRVRTSGGDIFIDTCHPDDDCVPSEVKIHLASPGLVDADKSAIPDGTFVHVVWVAAIATDYELECGSAVLVRNLPSWKGVANPTAGHTSLWLFATSSIPFDFVGAEEDRTALTMGEGAVCDTKDLEPLEVDRIKLAVSDAKVSVQVEPGESAMLTIPSGAQKGIYKVNNHFVAVFGTAGSVHRYAVIRQAP